MGNKKISVVKNGPFELIGVRFYKSAAGRIVPLDLDDLNKISLCRCGQSFEKPYCDGSHIIFEFNDTKDAFRAEDRVDLFVGDGITIHENKSV